MIHCTKTRKIALAAERQEIDVRSIDPSGEVVTFDPNAYETYIMYGDTNGDAVVVKAVLSESPVFTITDAMVRASDVNADGKITKEDAAILRRIGMGLEHMIGQDR